MTGEGEAPAAAADTGSAAVTGALLTDPPAGPGEREVQQVVYNSPVEYEGITGNSITDKEFDPAPVFGGRLVIQF